MTVTLRKVQASLESKTVCFITGKSTVTAASRPSTPLSMGQRCHSNCPRYTSEAPLCHSILTLRFHIIRKSKLCSASSNYDCSYAMIRDAFHCIFETFRFSFICHFQTTRLILVHVHGFTGEPSVVTMGLYVVDSSSFARGYWTHYIFDSNSTDTRRVLVASRSI